MNNKYSWNETLKFSWGHIIAFLAIIFISYVCYMGEFYKNSGDFKTSAIKVLIIDLLLSLTFLGAQILKGTDRKFSKSIVFERMLVCLCPIVFIWAMMPYNHFWSVYNEREQIESQFNTSIEKSKQMFVDYDDYASTRIGNYEQALSKIIQNKETDPQTYNKYGFSGSNDNVRKNNLITTLRLQLLSQNTDSLKTIANQWIANANQGATVWNAFLIGNVNQITEAIEAWNKALITCSTPILSSETASGLEVNSFASDNDAIEDATNGLKSLTQIYRDSNDIQLLSILTSMILFLMLFFPYILQRRSTRANGLYCLIPKGNSKSTYSQKVDKVYSENDNDNVDSSFNSSSDDIYGGTF